MSDKKILVADPEHGPSSPLFHLLESQNYEVSHAGSIEEAWRILTTSTPQLLLMEPMLPAGTEGFHLVWRLRDHPDVKLNGMPVILVSRIHQTTRLNLFPGISDGHYQADEYLPIQAFLDKPFDDRVLLETINNALR